VDSKKKNHYHCISARTISGLELSVAKKWKTNDTIWTRQLPHSYHIGVELPRIDRNKSEEDIKYDNGNYEMMLPFSKNIEMQSSLYNAYHRLRCTESFQLLNSIADRFKNTSKNVMLERLMLVKISMKGRIFGFCHIFL
jgi:hypothetical protein